MTNGFGLTDEKIMVKSKHYLLILLTVWLMVGATAHAANDKGVSLNMRDVDIRTVIDTVADVTRRNFLVDPRVKGKVTIISAKPMKREELYDAFLSILQVHGYAAIESGNIVKVVPDASAKQIGGPTYTGDLDQVDDDSLVTKVIAMQYVQAAQLVPVLRPLVPQNGHLAGYPDSNVLIITDRESNIARLSRIISRIDRPTGDEIEIIRLEHASANEVVAVITKLQGPKKKGGASRHLLASDERSNSILVSGDPAERVRIRGLIAHLDIPLERTGDTNVIFLKYALASELTTLLQGRFKVQKGAKGKGNPTRTVDIQADTYNNALVITASPKEFRNIQNVVRQLDIRRAQVIVEAVIAEVSTDLSQELGVQFAAGDRDGSGPILGTNLGPNSLPGILQSVAAGTPVTTPAGLSLAAGSVAAGAFNWVVLINALAGDAATNILSTPSIVATDNEEAEIVVGQNVPFVTGQYTTTTSGSGTGSTVNNPFQTIERQDIGITLKIKPQINEGSSVRLEIVQEVSSLAATSVSASDLVTNKRSIQTTVTVEDSQIVVLGGLIEDRYQDSEQKVPLFGDIPGLGQLFRYNSTKKIKQNLMVFLRPTILRDPALANRYSGQKYSYLRGRQLEAQLNERGAFYDSKGFEATGYEPTQVLPGSLEELFDPDQVPPKPSGIIVDPKPAAAAPADDSGLNIH